MRTSSNSGRCLIVEDDPDIGPLLAVALHAQALEVFVAMSLAEADRIVAAESIDVTVVDSALPDGKGVDWLSRQRRAGWKSRVVYMATDWCDPDTYNRLAYDCRVDWVTSKPVDIMYFAKQVRLLVPFPTGPVEGGQVPEILSAPATEKLDHMVAEARRLAVDAADTPAARRALRTLAQRLAGAAASQGSRRLRAVARQVEDAVSPTGPATTLQELPTLVDALQQALLLDDRPPVLPGVGTHAQENNTFHLLVVDDDPEFQWALTGVARRLAIRTTCVATSDEAVARLPSGHFDAAMVDVRLGNELGFDAVDRLRTLRTDAELPIVMVSAEDSFDHRVAALKAGASVFLSKPVSESALQGAVRLLTAPVSVAAARVLVVGAEPSLAAELEVSLRQAGLSPVFVLQGAAIVTALDEVLPDAVILAPSADGPSTATLCRVIRSMPNWAQLPILAIQGEDAAIDRYGLLRAGLTDWLGAKSPKEDIVRLVEAHLLNWRARREAAQRDWLSGLLLREPMTDSVGQLLANSRRRSRPMTIGLLDLDRFKSVNDRHGHAAGDRVIAALGQLLHRRLRTEDLRCRWGGEEFLVAMPDTDIATASAVLVRLLQEWQQTEQLDDDGAVFFCSFTVGLASTEQDGYDLTGLLGVADRNLYVGKVEGRGRVVGLEVAVAAPGKSANSANAGLNSGSARL